MAVEVPGRHDAAPQEAAERAAALIAVDAAGTLLSINPAAAALLRLDGRALTGRPATDLLADPADGGLLETGGSCVLQCGEGSLLVCTLQVGRIELDGRPLRIVTLTAAEEAARAARLNALLRSALDELPEALILFDDDDRLIYFNQAYRRIFPYMPGFDELEGAHFLDIVRRSMAAPGVVQDPLAREDPEAYLAKRIERLHRPHKGPFEQRVREGWHLVQELRIPEIGFVSLRSDITEVKRLEASLVEREELFRTLADTSPVAMVLTRLTDARVVYINPSASELFGVPLAEAPDKHAPDFYVDPADRTRLVERLKRDGVVQDAEIELKDAQDHPFWALLSGTATVYGGEPVLLISIIDISHRKRQERAIEEANRQLAELAERLRTTGEEANAARLRAEEASRTKSAFLAMMSHELRTPLNAVLGFSSILRDQLFGAIDEPKYVEYAQDIYESGAHLLSIINDILDLSKIEAGKMEIEREWLSAADLARSCRTLVRGLADENGVEIDQLVEPTDLKLHADRRAAKQMLVNLLSNACKFTPAGGQIWLRFRPAADGGVRVDVADDGIGMTGEEIARALEAFGQIARTGVSQKGTGLGLPLVQGLIELHGGRLEVCSRPGEGTTATLYFPPGADSPPAKA
ncbi:sensor histidine kinase [Tistlia consotensis]|uniref:sensor histidine kinase n=1 Tax=Tistlia consotensis TaxID=1321365 RepID=UPI000A148B25|nr:ATP-binding protein [Tistlia consotensis]